ncbi:MAG: hypothetical protein WA982_11890, partial [Rubrobacteraceae bacterium]
ERKLSEDTFVCIDPPYYNKGASLYSSFYQPDDHAEVADRVLSLNRPWITTYDDDDAIRTLYRERRQFEFRLNYSVQTKRVGTELLIASNGLRLSQELKNAEVNLTRKAG